MLKLEKLFSLPQPDFESGVKRPDGVLIRRLARYFAPKAVNTLSTPLLKPEVARVKERVTGQSKEDRAGELIAINTVFLPGQAFLRASPYHLDNWLRDSFLTSLAVNDPVVEKHLLDNFMREQRRYPQIPTTRLFASNREWYFDDESTMLAVVWRDKIAQMGHPLEKDEKQQWQDRLAWVTNHVKDGFYVTSPGTEKSWFDTFVFPQDVVTYNQGIYAVALLAANRLGLQLEPGQTKAAVEAYGKLTHSSGRLQLSRSLDYKDVSALFGEYIGITQFGESLLNPQTVLTTVGTFARDTVGYKVVVNNHDGYLHPHDFNRPYAPGDYHNGAEWPLFSAIAQVTAQYHGLTVDPIFWTRMGKNLKVTQDAEYVITGEDSDFPSQAPRYNPDRTDHAWNAPIYAMLNQPHMLI